MATTTISALSNTNTIDGATVVPADYSGATYKVTANTLGSFITNNATTVSATGNITGSYFIGNGSQLTGVDATQIINGTSNVKVNGSGGNITHTVAGNANIGVWYGTGLSITGDLTVTGNATLTGNILGDRIQNGTTLIDIQSASGNANITIGGTANVAVFATTGAFITGVTSVSGNVTGGNVLTAGLISATSTITSAANITGGNILTAGLLSLGGSSQAASYSASGNITGGNVLTGGLVSATGTITGSSHLGAVVSVTANITGGNLLTAGLLSLGGSSQAASYSASGNITGGNLTVSTGTVTVGNIVNANGNGVGNIGSTSLYFNTIFGKATTAQYADLAENYLGDAVYTSGTVLDFDGTQEVTLSTRDSSKRVAGVVSTSPAHLMNSTLDGAHVTAVALAGRVPTQVTGTIAKGDLMVSAGNGRARAETNPAVGTVIGKALENFDGGEGTIEIVISMQ